MPASRQFGFMDAWNNRNFAATRGYQDRTAVPRIRREQCDACRIRGHECDKSRLYGPCSSCINLGLLCSQSLMDGRGPGDDVNLGWNEPEQCDMCIRDQVTCTGEGDRNKSCMSCLIKNLRCTYSRNYRDLSLTTANLGGANDRFSTLPPRYRFLAMNSSRQMDEQSEFMYASNGPNFRRPGHEALMTGRSAYQTPNAPVKQCDTCRIQNRTCDGGRYNVAMSNTTCSYCATLRQQCTYYIVDRR